jgi:drug/metabolite transporter (DMT)-like permease
MTLLPKKISTEFIGSLYLIGAVLGWGWSIPFNKLLTNDIDPLSLIIIQLLASAIFLLTIIKFLKLKFSWVEDQILVVFFIGILEPGLAYYLGFIGVTKTSALHVSVIYALEPIGIIGFNFLLFQHKLKLNLIVVSIISFLGILIIASDDANKNIYVDFLSGDILIFLGVMMASLYVSLSVQYLKAIDVIKMLFIQQIGSLFLISVIFVISNNTDVTNLMTFKSSLVLQAVVLGVVQFGLSFLLYFLGAKRVTNYKGILILNMTPVIGILASIAVLHEHATIYFAVGAIIVFICTLYANLNESL